MIEHKLWLGLACIVILGIIMIRKGATESFDPMIAVKEVTTGEVKASRKSINSVALTGLTTRAPKSPNVFARLFQGAPSYSVIVRARPKYVLTNGVIVVGRSFTVEGFGETKESALARAYKKANDVQKGYANALKNAGLMK